MILVQERETSAASQAAPRLRLRIEPHAADGRGVELSLHLARDPRPGADRIDDLVVGGRLRLPVALAAGGEPPAPDRTVYFRGVRFALRDRQTLLAAAEDKGESPAALVTCALDRAAAIEAARALAGRASSLDLHAIATVDGRPAPLMLTVPLADLARDAGGTLDAWGRLLSPDPETGLLRLLPRRYTGASRGTAAAAPAVARVRDGFASLSAVAALSPIELAPATAIAVHPSVAIADTHAHLVAGESRFSPAARRVPHLPLLDDDGTGDFWSSADGPLPLWYLPAFVVVPPDPSRPSANAPFTFRFKETGHAVDGRPGIEAVVTLTLRRTRNASVAGDPGARPVPFVNLAVSLSIPFRDGDGRLRRELVTATTVDDGTTITATIPLLNNWARLAYGALGVESFQSEPARVQVAGCFKGVREAPGGPFPRALEPTNAVLPSPIVHRDGGGVSFATAAGTLAFTRPATSAVPRAARPVDAPLLAIHGRLQGETLAAASDQPIYSEETVFRTLETTCLLPCDRFGAFYIEETEDGDVPVGCRDALRLGETDYRLYARLEDARLPSSVQVFRSLLQPGRFLIVPVSYQIARFDADAGERAYRPAIFLYSSLDPAAPGNNRAALMATLGPAVAAHEMEHVREILRELSPAPTLQFVTEIPAKVSYAWSLANGEIVRDQQAIRRWDSFQISMSVDLLQAPLLQRMLETHGIAVVATFALPDGTTLRTALDLDLHAVVGPLGRTPVEVARVGGGVALVNRIEVAVDVDDLLVVDDAAAPGRPSIATRPVQKTLAPGERVVVDGEVAAAARLVPVATPKPSTAPLTEIRSFVEDVLAQMAFINLIAFDNHAVSLIAIDARLKGTSGVSRVLLHAADAVQTLSITLPLTTYLADPEIQFQATVTRRDGTTAATAWIDWPLDTKGNVVGVSWELLGLTH